MYERREQTRDEFNRAAYEADCEIVERGKTTYAYRISRSPSAKGQKVAEKLGKFGIKGIIYDFFTSNRDGKTTTYKGGAGTIRGGRSV